MTLVTAVKTGRVTKKKSPATKIKSEPLIDDDDVLDSVDSHSDGNDASRSSNIRGMDEPEEGYM